MTITAKASGDISGSDVSLHVTGTGAGPAVDQEVVAVGGTAWIRPAGGDWAAHPRAEAASAIDGVIKAIRLIDDPTQLVDAGVETVDGRPLHHLAAATTIVYRSGDGDGSYDSFDVWVTDTGVPVIAKASFSAQQGANALVGNTDVHYTPGRRPDHDQRPGRRPDAGAVTRRSGLGSVTPAG